MSDARVPGPELPRTTLELAARLPQPILLVTATGAVLFANEPAARLLGRTARALGERRLHEVLGRDPDLVAGWLASWSLGGDPGEAAWRGAVLEPSDDPARRLLALRHEPGPAGEPLDPPGAAALRQAQDELRDQVARLEAILQSAADGIITINHRGLVESFNPGAERLFGYAAAEVLGRTINDLMPSPYREEHDGYLERFLRTGERRIIGIGREVVGLRRDGSQFPMYLSVSEPIDLADRKLFTGIVHDLTERKLIEARLTQAAKLAAMGELAGNIAHEVNNPIGIVSAKARLLLSGSDPLPTKVRSDLEKMVAQCDRIGQLTRGLLEYCRPSINPKEPVDINEPVRRALSLIDSKAVRHGVEVVDRLAGGLPEVHGNVQELEQVFLNLLLNAIDAMPEGGKLTVVSGPGPRFERHPPSVLVVVEDTGTGMPPEIRSRVFEPFYTTKGVKGTGLGLSICFGLVVSHGGEIVCDSEVGVGTRFQVRLPVITQ